MYMYTIEGEDRQNRVAKYTFVTPLQLVCGIAIMFNNLNCFNLVNAAWRMFSVRAATVLTDTVNKIGFLQSSDLMYPSLSHTSSWYKLVM
jgi:hypothetical protein